MYPKVNQHIMIYNDNQGPLGRSLVAEVKDKEILIGFPIDSEFKILPDGTTIDITYVVGESQYKFHSVIIGKKMDKIPLYRVVKPQEKEIKKIQRRDNFRVYTNLRLQIKENEFNTVNISAGGLLFSCMVNFNFKKGDILRGTLYIPNEKQSVPVPFEGVVIRLDFENENTKNVAIEYNKIEQQHQMKIIQYCFEIQRQMRMSNRR